MKRTRHILNQLEEVDKKKLPISLTIMINPVDPTEKIVKIEFDDGSILSDSFFDDNDGGNQAPVDPYTHPAKTWVDKLALAGPVVISNISVDSLGHPTGWTTRNLTPQNIGAEPAFSKNTAFNRNFAGSGNALTVARSDHDHDYDKYLNWWCSIIGRGTLYVGSKQYLNFKEGDNVTMSVSPLDKIVTINSDPFYTRKTISFPNVPVYTINETGNVPLAFVGFDLIQQKISIADTNTLKKFLITARKTTSDAGSLILEDTPTVKFRVSNDELPIIVPGGTVMVISSETTTSASPNYKEYYVYGSLKRKDSSSSPGGTPAPVKRGTVVITASTILTAKDHDQMTLICKNAADINITIPSGLGVDFDCNIIAEDIGTRWVNFIQGSGTTLKAPHGTKLLDAYTCNIIKRTGAEIFNLQGELTP